MYSTVQSDATEVTVSGFSQVIVCIAQSNQMLATEVTVSRLSQVMVCIAQSNQILERLLSTLLSKL